MSQKDQYTSKNALDWLNRRDQRQLVPEAAGMSGVFQNSDTEEEQGNNLTTIASKITTRNIRSRLKPFIKKEGRKHIKYIKCSILQKRDEGEAVWPPETMKFLFDSYGISSVSYPVNYFDIVDKIFLMIFCLTKKIPLYLGCPPGNTCQWIRDLSPEDCGIVQDIIMFVWEEQAGIQQRHQDRQELHLVLVAGLHLMYLQEIIKGK